MPRVHNNPHAPCLTQREIAALNTYLGVIEGTIAAGTVYAAPCDLIVSPKSTPVG